MKGKIKFLATMFAPYELYHLNYNKLYNIQVKPAFYLITKINFCIFSVKFDIFN